jgi:hypothetical protein
MPCELPLDVLPLVFGFDESLSHLLSLLLFSLHLCCLPIQIHLLQLLLAVSKLLRNLILMVQLSRYSHFHIFLCTFAFHFMVVLVLEFLADQHSS